MIYHAGKMYYSLCEIAPAYRYSPEYLRGRIHQKKLMGVKFDGVWHSTKEWLQEYGNSVGEHLNSNRVEGVQAGAREESTERINLDRDSIKQRHESLKWVDASEGRFEDGSRRPYHDLKWNFEPNILITFSREGGGI